MSFTDWEFLTTGTVTHNLQTLDAIAGSSSLEIVPTGTTAGIAAQIDPDSFLTRGFTRGKIRTLLSMKDPENNVTVTDFFRAGIFFLADSPNYGSNTGDAYKVTPAPAGDTIDLVFDSIAAQTVVIASAPIQDSFGFQEEEVYPIEVEWWLNPTEFGGVRIIVRHGTQADFSDLEDVIDIIDAPGNQDAAGYEGLFVSRNSGSFGTPHWFFDNTSIWSIS